MFNPDIFRKILTAPLIKGRDAGFTEPHSECMLIKFLRKFSYMVGLLI